VDKILKKQSYRADITMVARVAGVSAATVSRAMNHPDMVNPTTRKKIEKAIRKTGYIRNRAAQAMHGRRSATLGLVVPTVNYSIFAELVQSFNDAVADLGFTLLLATHGYDLNAEYRVIRKMLEHRVDGIALIGLDHSDDTYLVFKKQNVPVVAAWSFASDAPISCIGADNAAAGRLAAEHVVALGHRRVGFIFPPTADNDRARSRIRAAMAVFEDAGVVIPDSCLVQSMYSIGQAKAVCLDLLRTERGLTALLCGNDVIAQGAIAAATQLGYRVPDDISIMGIGDFVGSGDIYPALSTVRVPAREIGTGAGQLLVRQVGGQEEAAISRTQVPVVLRARQTTARV
jgi:LacI family transcriptional regulator